MRGFQGESEKGRDFFDGEGVFTERIKNKRKIKQGEMAFRPTNSKSKRKIKQGEATLRPTKSKSKKGEMAFRPTNSKSKRKEDEAVLRPLFIL